MDFVSGRILLSWALLACNPTPFVIFPHHIQKSCIFAFTFGLKGNFFITLSIPWRYVYSQFIWCVTLFFRRTFFAWGLIFPVVFFLLFHVVYLIRSCPNSFDYIYLKEMSFSWTSHWKVVLQERGTEWSKLAGLSFMTWGCACHGVNLAFVFPHQQRFQLTAQNFSFPVLLTDKLFPANTACFSAFPAFKHLHKEWYNKLLLPFYFHHCKQRVGGWHSSTSLTLRSPCHQAFWYLLSHVFLHCLTTALGGPFMS